MTNEKPRVKAWTENVGLELEEALSMLILLDEMTDGKFTKDIEELQDLIASEQIEKILEDK